MVAAAADGQFEFGLDLPQVGVERTRDIGQFAVVRIGGKRQDLAGGGSASHVDWAVPSRPALHGAATRREANGGSA